MANGFLKRTPGDYVFEIVNILIMVFLLVVTLYPIYNTIIYSLNDGLDSMRAPLYFWPREFTWGNYQKILGQSTIYRAAFISVARTTISTVFGVLFTTMLAYTLARKEYMFRKPITLIFVFTMYVNAGLIPTYFLMRGLGLVNNFMVYIWPLLIHPFHLIVVRTYIKSIPESLVESARIDGASEYRTFFRIIFPLSKPVIATIALFIAVWAWNSWYDTFIYAPGEQALSTLQYELKKLVTTANPSAGSSVAILTEPERITPKSLKATITVVTALPIVLVYPFLQRYFVAGLSVGSVKG